jgi:hypothetical protein
MDDAKLNERAKRFAEAEENRKRPSEESGSSSAPPEKTPKIDSGLEVGALIPGLVLIQWVFMA